MQKRVLLITGAPGVGKTTLLQKIVDELRDKGIMVGGMVSVEARRNNIRVGFEILDLQSGSKGWLAHINGLGPSIGKYHVKLQDLEGIGAKAINDAAETCQVIAIDEVGPMELPLSSSRKQFLPFWMVKNQWWQSCMQKPVTRFWLRQNKEGILRLLW